MTYIKDSIGSEYMQWQRGDVVFISSPTGSGKTTFILNDLLPFLAQRGKKILYFVNRTVLKKQLEEEIKWIQYEFRKCITIELYQSLENDLAKLKYSDGILQADWRSIENRYRGYDCVVCDEAHYFMMDSNYNTNTILSYKFIDEFLRDRIRVYMSATIDDIEEVICQDNKKEKAIESFWLGCPTKWFDCKSFLSKGQSYHYRAEKIIII